MRLFRGYSLRSAHWRWVCWWQRVRLEFFLDRKHLFEYFFNIFEWRSSSGTYNTLLWRHSRRRHLGIGVWILKYLNNHRISLKSLLILLLNSQADRTHVFFTIYMRLTSVRQNICPRLKFNPNATSGLIMYIYLLSSLRSVPWFDFVWWLCYRGYLSDI